MDVIQFSWRTPITNNDFAYNLTGMHFVHLIVLHFPSLLFASLCCIVDPLLSFVTKIDTTNEKIPILKNLISFDGNVFPINGHDGHWLLPLT